ncbi:MAG: hypothetical protein IJ981_02780 [Clostridia bacterium]|nr:hypothetical protein [Clostridia bacterium]
MKNFEYVNEQNFEEKVLNAKMPVIVYFWTMWSADCQKYDYVLDKIEQKFRGSLIFVGINVNECPNLTQKYNVQVLPTTLFFKNGQYKIKENGILSETILLSQIKRIIKD